MGVADFAAPVRPPAERRPAAGERSNRIPSIAREAVPFHRGLALCDDTEYPEEITGMLDRITTHPTLLAALDVCLHVDPTPRHVATVMRAFARADELEAAFAWLHVASIRGVPVTRGTMRSLAFAASRYGDIELALFSIECALQRRVVDVPSLKRVFDACTEQVDLRGWTVYDALVATTPTLSWVARANLQTSMYVTQIMRALGMQKSKRSGRGYITLPNPRGEIAGPWRVAVDGLMVYREIDMETGRFLDPKEYDDEQKELVDVMLELEDGTVLRDHHLERPLSIAAREAEAVFAETRRRIAVDFAELAAPADGKVLPSLLLPASTSSYKR